MTRMRQRSVGARAAIGALVSKYLGETPTDVQVTVTWDTNGPAGTVTRIERNNVVVYPVG